MSELKVGDMIKCYDKEELVDYMEGLMEMGIETEFVYEKDGVKGLWLEVTKVEN